MPRTVRACRPAAAGRARARAHLCRAGLAPLAHCRPVLCSRCPLPLVCTGARWARFFPSSRCARPPWLAALLPPGAQLHARSMPATAAPLGVPHPRMPASACPTLQVRLGERGQRWYKKSSVHEGLLVRSLKPSERWLEFRVSAALGLAQRLGSRSAQCGSRCPASQPRTPHRAMRRHVGPSESPALLPACVVCRWRWRRRAADARRPGCSASSSRGRRVCSRPSWRACASA